MSKLTRDNSATKIFTIKFFLRQNSQNLNVQADLRSFHRRPYVLVVNQYHFTFGIRNSALNCVA